MSKSIPIRRRDGSVRAVARVDDGDYERLSFLRWHLHSQGYAASGGGNTKRFMHRMILDLPTVNDGSGSGARRLMVDHINGDKLDNRRVNLRTVTMQQNQQNAQRRWGVSQYRGVFLDRKSGRWYAQVAKQHGGIFETEIEAAVAAYEMRRRMYPYSHEDRPVAA